MPSKKIESELDEVQLLFQHKQIDLCISKINKIIQKDLGNEYYESLLVIDGTTGQNGLTQAKVFNEVTKLTGFIIMELLILIRQTSIQSLLRVNYYTN